MKKIIAVLAVLSFTAAAFAQTSGFGIIAGVTSSQVNIKEVNAKSASGFNAGVAYRMPLTSGLVLQPGLVYNVKGSNWDELKAGSKFGYVELPVQLQWGIDMMLLRPYVFAEPFIGYAVSGKEFIDKTTSKIDMSALENRLEYGFGVGGGVDLFDRLQLSLKYFWNFEDSSIKDVPGLLSGNIDDRKSFDGLILSVGFFFGSSDKSRR